MLEFDVSLLQIQVFLAVAEQHSFSKAAEQVNLEQSTVSRRIGVLERDDEVLVCDRFLRDYANPLLRVFPLPDTWSALCAVRRRGNANPLLMAFLEELRRYYR